MNDKINNSLVELLKNNQITSVYKKISELINDTNFSNTNLC